MVQGSGFLAVLATSAALVQAHPGQSHASKVAELKARSDFIAGLEHRDLAQCTGSLAKRGEISGMVERRMETLKALRRERGIPEHDPHRIVKRQQPSSSSTGGLAASLSSLLGGDDPIPSDGASLLSWMFTPKGVESAAMKKKHKSTLDVTAKTDWSVLGKGKTTVLAPDVTEGPYYVGGEIIRKNVRDAEKGVNVTLDIQVIDMTTCKPMPKVAVEIWAANSTGVYSGVIDVLGVIDPSTAIDMSKFSLQSLQTSINNKAVQQLLNKQTLRGMLLTNKDGAVQFETLVPGFYSGRTPHIHVATHLNVTVQSNKTIAGGTVPYVGQLYFDQDLLDQVALVPPYTTNTNPRMKNKNDFLMQQGSAGEADPIVEYVLVGDTLADGIFAWINFGIDPTKKRLMSEASSCSADGCKSAIGEVISAFANVQKALPALNSSAIGLVKNWNVLSTALNNTKGVTGLVSSYKDISASYKGLKTDWDSLSSSLKSIQGAMKTLSGYFGSSYAIMQAQANMTTAAAPKAVPSLAALSNTTAKAPATTAQNMGFYAAVGAALGGLVGYLIPVTPAVVNTTIPSLPNALPSGLLGSLSSMSADPLPPKATSAELPGANADPFPMSPVANSSQALTAKGKGSKSSSSSSAKVSPSSMSEDTAAAGTDVEATAAPAKTTGAPSKASKAPKASASPKASTPAKSTDAPMDAGMEMEPPLAPATAESEAAPTATPSRAPKAKGSPKSSAPAKSTDAPMDAEMEMEPSLAPAAAETEAPAATTAEETTPPPPLAKTTATPKKGAPPKAAKGKAPAKGGAAKTTKKPGASVLVDDEVVDG